MFIFIRICIYTETLSDLLLRDLRLLWSLWLANTNIVGIFSVSGDRCEFDHRQGRCMPGVCRNGGTCRELSGGGFRCECPAGAYERPYCTVTARSFPPKSFVMFRGLRQRFHLSISLTWVDLSKHSVISFPVFFSIIFLSLLSASIRYSRMDHSLIPSYSVSTFL